MIDSWIFEKRFWVINKVSPSAVSKNIFSKRDSKYESSVQLFTEYNIETKQWNFLTHF